MDLIQQEGLMDNAEVCFRDIFSPWWQVMALAILMILPMMGILPQHNLGPDSGGYIALSLTRPPLYHLFIELFGWTGYYQFIFVRWTQALLTFLALLYFGAWLQTRLGIPVIIRFAILVSFAILFLFKTKILSFIFAEGLTLPLFFVTFPFLVEIFFKPNMNKFIIAVAGSNLMILAREQFYFLHFFIMLAIVWYIWQRETNINIGKCLMVVTIILLMSTSIKHGYVYAIKSKPSYSPYAFTGTQWQYRGWRLLEQPMYLATAEDASLFTNPVEKHLFEQILIRLDKEGLTRRVATSMARVDENSVGSLLLANYHYISVLGRIQDNIRFAVDEHYPRELTGDQVDKNLLRMAKILYAHHMYKNAVFYLWRLGLYVGGFWIVIPIAMILMAITCRIVSNRSWKPTITQCFIMVALLFILLNASLISVVEILTDRYFCYSYALYICFGGLLAKQFFMPDHQLTEGS